MGTLGELQGDFQDYLLRGDAAVERHVLGTPRVPAATRLGIYAHAYRSRLAEALGSNFPALARLLGESDFATLAAEYVRTHDSPFFSIRYYGDDLANFLGAHEDYAAAPLLAELARWEWLMTGVFDAADAEPLEHERLARVPPGEWAQLRFTLHPSVQRIALHWNVPPIWQALTEGLAVRGAVRTAVRGARPDGGRRAGGDAAARLGGLGNHRPRRLKSPPA
jgi:hypothetical protein